MTTMRYLDYHDQPRLRRQFGEQSNTRWPGVDDVAAVKRDGDDVPRRLDDERLDDVIGSISEGDQVWRSDALTSAS